MEVSRVIDPLPGVRLWVTATDRGISRISFTPLALDGDCENALLDSAARQLEEYFARCRQTFDLTLDVRGRDFQRRVWNAVAAIPYGETRSYAEIAQQVGSPKAVRAVGAANGANPVPILVPCHRVVNSNGKLGGYGGGLEMKSRLLALESGLF